MDNIIFIVIVRKTNCMCTRMCDSFYRAIRFEREMIFFHIFFQFDMVQYHIYQYEYVKGYYQFDECN